MSSRVVVPVSALIAILLLSVMPPIVREAHGAQAHASHALPAPAEVPAHRWATDAALRDGMRRIRTAVVVLGHYRHGHMDAAQAANAVDLIDAAVGDIVANCRLAPDADIALHGLLAKFLSGASALREAPEPPTAAIAGMREALARYPQLFDDPQWDASAD